jgi:Flp pilus assembly protein TadG
MKSLRTLFADRKGVAAIEFAFVSVFLFGILMVALDFGFYTQQRLKLGGAVEQAAIIAYNQQLGTTATPSTATVSNYVQTYSGLKNAPVATITCNGTANCGDGKCSCITSAGGFSIVATCNLACPTGGLSGNYLQVSATATYNSVIVPDKYLNGGQMTQVAVVRLQ